MILINRVLLPIYKNILYKKNIQKNFNISLKIINTREREGIIEGMSWERKKNKKQNFKERFFSLTYVVINKRLKYVLSLSTYSNVRKTRI